MVASRTLLQWLLACLNFILDSQDLFCWYKKKVISLNYGNSRSNIKPWRWVRLDLLLTMRDIYINSNLNQLTKFTSTGTEFKDVFPWNISQMIRKTIPISTRIILSYAMKWSILFWVWWKFNRNWKNNMVRTSQWKESHCKTNTSIRRNK